jgi:hypothetical protein
VQRDMSIASDPSQVQLKLNAVCAMRCGVPRKSASIQFSPPSVDTSTLLTTPPPDQAKPLTS